MLWAPDPNAPETEASVASLLHPAEHNNLTHSSCRDRDSDPHRDTQHVPAKSWTGHTPTHTHTHTQRRSTNECDGRQTGQHDRKLLAQSPCTSFYAHTHTHALVNQGYRSIGSNTVHNDVYHASMYICVWCLCLCLHVCALVYVYRYRMI